MGWEIKTPRAARQNARLAGFIGLIVLITGSFAHSVNLELFDYNDAIQTSVNLLKAELLYRLGFVSSLLMQTIFIFYALYLYRLLKNIDKLFASLMMILVLVPVPIFLINQLHQYAVFLLAERHEEVQMLFYLDLHKSGGYIVAIFYGLWLFPLGYLVFKSGFLPKFLGILLMMGCFGYLISFIQGFLFPDVQNTLWANPVLIVAHVAELLLMLWLLFKGLNEEKWLEQN